jgi:hypothetical protein
MIRRAETLHGRGARRHHVKSGRVIDERADAACGAEKKDDPQAQPCAEKREAKGIDTEEIVQYYRLISETRGGTGQSLRDQTRGIWHACHQSGREAATPGFTPPTQKGVVEAGEGGETSEEDSPAAAARRTLLFDIFLSPPAPPQLP